MSNNTPDGGDGSPDVRVRIEGPALTYAERIAQETGWSRAKVVDHALLAMQDRTKNLYVLEVMQLVMQMKVLDFELSELVTSNNELAEIAVSLKSGAFKTLLALAQEGEVMKGKVFHSFEAQKASGKEDSK